MFLIASDGHINVSPAVQARAHKLRHVFQRILVCHRARHSARNATHQHQDGDSRLLVTVLFPSEKHEASVPRSAVQMGHLFRNGRCNGSWCVTSSSVGSLDPRFTRGARSSSGKSGSCFFLSFSTATGINDTRRNFIVQQGFRHGVSQLSERTVQGPTHQPPPNQGKAPWETVCQGKDQRSGYQEDGGRARDSGGVCLGSTSRSIGRARVPDHSKAQPSAGLNGNQSEQREPRSCRTPSA